jgi:phosphohistidine phosphatase
VTVRLFLVRHAPAVASRRGAGDADRRLSPRGRLKFVLVARGLRRLGIRFDRVLYSPKARAAETAEILAPLVKGTSASSQALTRAPSAALLNEIRGERVAVVGHEPWLSALAAWLVTGDRDRGTRFEMKKGGVIVLEGDPRPGAMRLVAALPPKVLRRIGKA